MTPFGFASTADEVLADVDLSGNRGGCHWRGFGYRGRDGKGASFRWGRGGAGGAPTRVGRGRRAAGITESMGNKAVTMWRLDLADQVSVAEFVDEWDGPLHSGEQRTGLWPCRS